MADTPESRIKKLEQQVQQMSHKNTSTLKEISKFRREINRLKNQVSNLQSTVRNLKK